MSSPACGLCGSGEASPRGRPVRLSRLAGLFQPGAYLCVLCRDAIRFCRYGVPREPAERKTLRVMHSYQCWRNKPRKSAS